MFVACKVANGLVINGAGKQATLLGPGKVTIPERVGGYAITPDVPKELWDEWVKVHADSELIQGNMIFAEENLEVLRARAWSRTRVTTGLEQGRRN